ncbi:vWA domain-containing protein [Sutcliffiella halmapala]|uniref:vWA domain-containing protein n=1 Tax=Sutcliffiella halmapala TaxID=79882 RepID=UPI000994CD8B|nr:VWA domain-containing protein [Sutcliffiella halmapala]
MGFTTPIIFILTIFLLLVIFMYFFRKQYENKTVPSVLLWQEWMNDFEAQAWWKKLQHHLLLYLQLLALLLLIFTLAQPFIQKEGIEGDHIVLIFDTSATMTALDGDKTRLEIAKAKSLDTLQQLDKQDITVIIANESPIILDERSKSKREIRRIIEKLEPHYGSSNILDSIQLAKGLIGEELGQIHLYTDSFSRENELVFHEKTAFFSHNIGEDYQNLSLGTFAVVNREDSVVGVATVMNEGKEPMDVILSIFSEEETIFETTEQLKPNQTKTIYFEDLAHSDVYRAEVSGDSQYKLDNVQYAFLAEQQDTTIYVHDAVHPFVRKAVEITNNNVVHLTSTTTTEKEGVHIIRGESINEWPMGPKLVFLPTEESKEGLMELDEKLTVDETHSLLNLIELEKVYMERTHQIELDGIEVIAEKGANPLIYAGQYEGYPIIVVGIEIEASDWALHPSFPLFIYNSIQYLTEGQNLLGYFYPGQLLDYYPSSDTKFIEIFDDSEDVVFKQDQFDKQLEMPNKPGLYRFKESKETSTSEKFLQVILQDQEKSIKTEKSFVISSMEEITEETNKSKKDITSIFLILALLILLLEWEVYRRASTN